ncbi:MAG: EAL domain-containing protein [Lachnospiraceae bacterium]|nr:EAL domain-containing protein [Lachnospiraceae bacterium]
MFVYTQACGVVVLGVLLALFYLKRSKIFLNTEKIFILTLVTSLFANVIDILCQVLLYNSSVPLWISRFFCETYQILIIMVLCCTMIYICRDIYEDNKIFVKKIWLYIVIFILSGIAIFVLPENLSTEPGKLYAYGVSVTFSYAVALFYIIAVLIRVNVQSDKMNSDRRVSINLWMALWIFVAIFENIFPSIFVAGFATSIGVMILYVKLENPGMNIDRQSGFYNQNAFMEYIQQLYGSHKKFSMIMVVINDDEDGFYNHKLELKKISKILDANDTVVFRKTEDEIVLVFKSANEAKEWGANFVESTYLTDDPDMIALRNGLWISIEDSEWFKNSEELMYFIKYAISHRQSNVDSKARNFIKVSKEMVSEMSNEKKVEKMIVRALKEDRIEVFYQPIYSTEKKMFTTAEALVRIRDIDGKIVPPGVFIPVAERTGKIIDLGNEVFRQVCKLIKEDNITKYGIEYVEVNLSVAQCGDYALAENYIAQMEAHDVNPNNINLEITESASLKSKEVLLDNMNRLIDYGVNFSLDDFGTGQSNLNYIVDMPVDIVKFDRGMINSYFANQKARHVMDAAMHMIHGMGLKIVSEGIETGEQFGKMNELGISYIQGFYFSKPLEKQDFIKFLIENNNVSYN